MATVKTDTDYSGRPVRPVEELIPDDGSFLEKYIDRFLVLEDGTEVADFGDVGYPLGTDGHIDFDHPIPLK